MTQRIFCAADHGLALIYHFNTVFRSFSFESKSIDLFRRMNLSRHFFDGHQNSYFNFISCFHFPLPRLLNPFFLNGCSER